MGLSHQVEEYWTTLIKGTNLIKCGRRGQPHIHFFRLSETQDALVWESKGRQRRVPLNQVRKILQGQKTTVFTRNKGSSTTKGLEKLSLSLVYGHRAEDRTLDVIFQTIEEFHLWHNALKYVTDHLRTHAHQHKLQSPRVSPTGSILGGGQTQGFGHQTLAFPVPGSSPGDCYIWGAPPEASTVGDTAGLELTKVTSPHLVPDSHKLDLIHVSCGPCHFTAVTRNGNLYTWGSGDSGRLGLGSSQHVHIPLTVPKLRSVVSISCGDANSAAITSDGDLYTWGSGISGQLGHGNTVAQYQPKRVVFSDIKIRHVSCGPFHTAAISESGSMYTWGDGFGGKLGHGNEEALSAPKRVEGLTDVYHVSCGWWHTAAVSRVGADDPDSHRMALFTWGGICSWDGDSNKGCLGNDSKNGEWHPTRISGPLVNKNVRAVACGLNLTVVLTRDGSVFQMGTTAAEDTHVPWEGAKIPTKVEGSLKRVYAEQIACGRQHVVVVGSSQQSRSSNSKKNHVYAWGNGKRGQLGLGTHKDHSTPQFIEDLGPRKVVNVCCGGDYTLIVCSHDHKVAAANTAEIMAATTPVTTELSPTSAAIPRRSTVTTGGTGITSHQLRMPKKPGSNHREGVGSLEHISVASSSSSIRKMKSDVLYGGQRLDRSRTGSTPMSDAPSEQRTPQAEDRRSASSYQGVQRCSTPLAFTDMHEGHRQASVPDLTSAEVSSRPKFDQPRANEAESVVSDPGDQGDDSSSDDDTSVANTEGQFTQDGGYSEDDVSVHRSAPSFSDKGIDNDQQGGARNLPDSFKMPIMPFPPTTDVVPTSSTRSLSRSLASAARIRTRQKGLERRLGITDTWTSDRLISKQSSSPADVDLLNTCALPSRPVIFEEGSQTARDVRPRPSNDPHQLPKHRRTTSEQNMYLNSLKESLKNVGDSKTKILNYGKLLESVEERLIAIAAKQKAEIREMDPELISVLKLLDSDENHQQIASFFEADTVEKTMKTVQQLTDLLDTAPLPNNRSPPKDSVRSPLTFYEQLVTQLQELMKELRKSFGLVVEDFSRSDNAITRQESTKSSTTAQNIAESASLVPSNSGQLNDGSTQLVQMWMERVDPGVSIVFQSTNSGTTKIKKIRFAKRMFAWDEAQRWWEQNQERLIRDYQLEPGFDPLNPSNSEG